jgi:hypothetical protein
VPAEIATFDVGYFPPNMAAVQIKQWELGPRNRPYYVNHGRVTDS